MDENGEILPLHASKNNMHPFVLPFYMTLSKYINYKNLLMTGFELRNSGHRNNRFAQI